MSINIQTTGVHHLALRSTDLPRSRRFYVDTLGFTPVIDTESAFVFLAGSTVIGVLAPDDDTTPGDRFSSSRVGVDHLAMGCRDEQELARVAKELATHGVENTGIKTDTATDKQYIAFNDPDGIIWELYRV